MTADYVGVVPEVASRPRVVAIVPAYNEADVIGHAIGALVEEGIEVYLLDHGSTDDTVAVAEAWLGRGLLRIERFPQESGFPERNERELVWKDMLRRVEQVAHELRPDWAIFSNADEFRESPWPDLGLVEAIGFVDALGYNALNFELFDFKPIDDAFVPGTDPRAHLRHYERGGDFDAHQIKAWKVGDEPALLHPSGGHSVQLPDRRLCPVPFILRHYPLRGETHGRRKVFGERIERFAAEERAEGWHVQYDAYAAGDAKFLRDPAELVRWDGDAVRARLLARASRDHLLAHALRPGGVTLGEMDATQVAGWASRATGSERSIEQIGNAIRALETQMWPEGDPALLATAARLLTNELRQQGRLRAALEVEERQQRTFAAAAEAPTEAVRLEGVRPVAILALADEILASPALLQAWGDEFDGADDVTLVIAVPCLALDPTAAALTELAAAAGLDGDDAADLLLHPCDDLTELADTVAGVYGSGGGFGTEDLAQLRAELLSPAQAGPSSVRRP
jgi:Glycosyl transferase family 2